MPILRNESGRLDPYNCYLGPRITNEACLLVGVFMACGEDRIDLRPTPRGFYPMMIFHQPANCQLQRRFGWTVTEEGDGCVSHDDHLLLLYETRLRYVVRTDVERDQVQLLQRMALAGKNGCSSVKLQPIYDAYCALIAAGKAENDDGD